MRGRVPALALILAFSGCDCVGSSSPCGSGAVVLSPDVLLGIVAEEKEVEVRAPLPAICIVPHEGGGEGEGGEAPSHLPTSITIEAPNGESIPFSVVEENPTATVLRFTPAMPGLHVVRAVFQPNRGTGHAWIEVAERLPAQTPTTLPARCGDVDAVAGGFLCDSRIYFSDGGSLYLANAIVADEETVWTSGSPSDPRTLRLSFPSDGGLVEELSTPGLASATGGHQSQSAVPTRTSLELLANGRLWTFRVDAGEDGGLALGLEHDVAFDPSPEARLFGDGERLFSVANGVEDLNPEICELARTDAGRLTGATTRCSTEEALFYSVNPHSAYFVGRTGGTDLEITRFVPTPKGTDRARIALPRSGALETPRDFLLRGVPAISVPQGWLIPTVKGGDLTLQYFPDGDEADFSVSETHLWVRDPGATTTRVFRR